MYYSMIHPVPAPLKLHQSLLYAMDMVGQSFDGDKEYARGHHATSPAAASMYSIMEKNMRFGKTDLRVEFRDSSYADDANSNVKHAARDIRSKLALSLSRERSSVEALSGFKLSGSKRNVWSEMQQLHASAPASDASSVSLDTSDSEDNSCSYASLRFEEYPGGLAITGLDRVTAARGGQHCFANLVATIALETNIVNVYLRPHDTVLNDAGKSIVQGETSSSGVHPYQAAGLDGTGQIVGVGDTGVDDLHCFFINSDGLPVAKSSTPMTDNSNRKIIQYISYVDDGDTSSGHGTHVSGTIVGFDESGSLSSQQGHASGAKMTIYDMSSDGNSIYYGSPLSDKVFAPSYSAGGRIHSNSWGSTWNTYTSECRDTDEYHYETDDFLALFAAGNDGDDGFYSIGTPATAKNSMAIGASQSNSQFDTIAYFSSMGPTFDGRIKPDVVAPGFFTTSSDADPGSSSCGTTLKAGTSMATPAVAGNAAIIRQFFEDSSFWATTCNPSYSKCGAMNPRGATVKAMLVHSGEAMSSYPGGATEGTVTLGTTPDILQGFGRVTLSNILPLSGTTVAGLDLFVDELSMTSYTTTTYQVTVTDTTAPLKVSIAWMDPPSDTLSDKLLIHDIDVKVIYPTGAISFGNEFAGDEENNVEQVFISTPATGVYDVVVTAKNILSIPGYVNSDQQKISVIITSVGSVADPVSASVSADTANHPLQCALGESQVTLSKYDQGTNGWNEHSYAILRSSDGVEVRTGTLNDPTKGNFYQKETFCLLDGAYTVQLVLSGDDEEEEVGLSIHSCDVYLDNLQTSDSFSFSSNSCNSCSENSMEIALVGSVAGVPYGWNGDSALYIKSDDGSVDILTTLLVGVVDVRGFCLPDGFYNIGFSGVPAEDDWGGFNYGYSEEHFGVEEYEVDFSCGSTDITLEAFDCTNSKCVQLSDFVYVELNSGACSVVPTVGVTCECLDCPAFDSAKCTSGDDACSSEDGYAEPSCQSGDTTYTCVIPGDTCDGDESTCISNCNAFGCNAHSYSCNDINPTAAPTAVPTVPGELTKEPTEEPTAGPTASPSTAEPTAYPSLAEPTVKPSLAPSAIPSTLPTANPTHIPSSLPSGVPTSDPTTAALTEALISGSLMCTSTFYYLLS
jgi:hypothetical protein